MNQKKAYRFHTQVMHTAQSPKDWQGATLPPIFQTASHQHPTAENLSDTFGGKTTDHIYMRLTNPTNRVLEEKLASLEKGQGAVVMSSGMAAITNACMALLRMGDEFVTGNSLFMSTYVLFANVFKKYGITARFVESTDTEAIEKAINEKTRFVFLKRSEIPRWIFRTWPVLRRSPMGKEFLCWWTIPLPHPTSAGPWSLGPMW